MEEKKNEFDDILLDKVNKGEKLKKILLRAIILIIVFLVVMIAMKLLNSGEEKDLQVPTEPNQQNVYNDNFDNLAITESNTEEDEFEALARKLKEDSALVENNTSQVEIPSEPSLNTSSVLDQISNLEANETKEPASISEKDTNKETPKINTEVSKQKPIVSEKTTPAKPKPQTNANELFEDVKTQNTSSKLASGAYIQVFSLNTLDPKSKELTILKENGYEYKIYKTSVNGKELTKVLVGPYNESELKVELEKIRSKIAKGAFTFRIK